MVSFGTSSIDVILYLGENFMNKKLLVTAVGAFGAGALISWAITADIYENRFKQERAGYDELLGNKTDHIFALKARLDNPVNDNNEPATLRVNTWVMEHTSDDVNPDQMTVEDIVVTEETPEEARSNLQKVIDEYTADPEAQQDFASMVGRSVETDNSPPFIIPKVEYAYDEEGEDYAKITVTYYPRDRVLLDDDDEPIENVNDVVGWRNLTKFGVEPDDPYVVFIRNRRLTTDFEVLMEDESPLPLHVKYGMEKDEFRASRAAGLIKLRQEDDDY
jgi:hypothetical protein